MDCRDVARYDHPQGVFVMQNVLINFVFLLNPSIIFQMNEVDYTHLNCFDSFCLSITLVSIINIIFLFNYFIFIIIILFILIN